MCKRGDIYYVDFGDNQDSCKQSGIRPAVIVSNNKNNQFDKPSKTKHSQAEYHSTFVTLDIHLVSQ